MAKGTFVVVAVVLAVLAVAAAASAIVKPDSDKLQFLAFVHKHSKSYAADEYPARFEIFKTNLALIEKLNAKQSSAQFGVTKFSDMTQEEFRSKHLNGGKNLRAAANSAPKMVLPSNVAIPDEFDWRSRNAVTPAKDQGQCGSCWAFSVTEAIESQWFLSNGSLPVLSPQQIVDCDLSDQGCGGGYPTSAYQYVMRAGGLDTEASYPYAAEVNDCAFNASNVAARISNWTYVTTTKNETEMQIGLVNSGPLSICVDAASWQFYFGGVISFECGTDLDHCVMATGYSNQTGWDTYEYQVWNIRNSWGEDWGYDGYLYVKRNSDLCGVADLVTLPVV